ncbi:transcription initiation protein [Sphingobacterium sp. N143]|uniref:YciI family protein n=1 Tax=Sphingobacterium sp. N143 TaxID=2746727 RepID=UPI0025756183|nr:YciI family protein [Sphingobacterium sp. N143]MDM1296149.1 transcription initiation protein [Sphingobacterium sp. N143]
MKDFILLFRQAGNEQSPLTAEQIATTNKKWHDWIADIEAQGKLKDHGSRLEPAGKVLKPGGVITDGPFVEIRERLGGFIVVSAENLDEATTLAHGCPILESNGSVEIRALFV